MSSSRLPDASPPRSVCLAISTLARPGGAERVVGLLADAWNRAGVRVTILTLDSPDAPRFFQVAAGIDVLNLDTAGESRSIWRAVVRNLGQIARIRRALRDVAPDVVISFIDVLNVSVVVAALGTHIPVIAAERTSPEHAPIGRWKFLRNIAYRLADRVVVQSSGAYDFFRRAIGSRLAIIPNPVPSGATTTRAPGGFGVIAIGRFTEEKDFDLLIRSFGVAAAQFRDWTLTIFGDGPLRPDLENLVTAEGLGERVFLPGITNDSRRALAAAEVFVLSSRFEGFPNALCEAMAAGVASIATDCPHGPREIVHDGVDGVLVPPGDRDALAGALMRLMGSPAERQRLGTSARLAVARFSIETVLGQWNALIAGVRAKR